MADSVIDGKPIIKGLRYDRQDPDYFARIGSLGGSAPKTRPAGFKANRHLASAAGRIGGSMSSRRKLTEQEKWERRQSPEVLKAYKELTAVRDKHLKEQGRAA